MSSPNVSETMKHIEEFAAMADNETRYVRQMDVGQVIRQGDIYVTRLPDGTQLGKETTQRQLAPGSTNGSRHVIDGDTHVVSRNGNALIGPVFRVDGDQCEISHPEHAHVVIFQRGVYGVTYQRDFAQEERTRVND